MDSGRLRLSTSLTFRRVTRPGINGCGPRKIRRSLSSLLSQAVLVMQPTEMRIPERRRRVSGFVLEYDAARKIAQGLGAHLEQLASLIEVKGATARLLPVAERTRSLFQKGEVAAPIGRGKLKRKSSQ